jgi:hypothetical protein
MLTASRGDGSSKFLLLGLAVALGACGPSESSSSAPVYHLPGQTPEPGLVGCAGVAWDPPFRLRGDETRDLPVWASRDAHEVVPIVWPVGYFATFDGAGTVEVHASDGSVVMKEGDAMADDPERWPDLVVCAGPSYVHVYLRSELSL